jgi:eukaryotic-like serine/threonine-protein kinase
MREAARDGPPRVRAHLENVYPRKMPYQGTPAAVPSPGQVLGGKYLIHRLLGEGGMAFVFEASHQRLGQRVAVKLLHPDFARDTDLVARFEREARALALLKSRHVARVSDVDATLDGLPYIVMEFLQGRDLDAELQQRGRIPVDEAVDYVLQSCAAMAEAHGVGIVHRDLKPANLFLAEDNGERIVKVLDFGISKVVGETTRLTGSGAVMGTVLYMSPEQVRAAPDVDTRADIWALGMILYELVAGRAPWEGSSHQIAAAIVSGDAADVRSFAAVPDGLATALRTTLARDRNHRYASVRELAAALVPFTSPTSLGAAVADQLASGHSSPRMRPAYASFSNLSVAAPPPSSMQAAPAATQIGASEDGRVRVFVAVGAVLGILAAVGIVLMFVAIGARRSAAVADSQPPPSAPAPSVEAQSATTAAAAVPSSPSTGLAEAVPSASTSTSTSTSTKRQLAPTARPTASATATPAAPVSAPPFL